MTTTAETLTVTPDDLLITEQLFIRPDRAPNLQAELAAFRDLSATMAVDPDQAVQRFLEPGADALPCGRLGGLERTR